MHPKSPKLLHDILEACNLIQTATQDRTLRDYELDRVLCSAVERNFEIIGEALKQLAKVDSATAGRIPERGAIIGFRNLLIHGCDYVDHSRVWAIIQNDVPRLREQVEKLLREAEEQTEPPRQGGPKQ